MLLRPLERVCILMVFAMIAINTMLAFEGGKTVSGSLIIAAIIIAGLAMIIGLFFADEVVLFVQRPLEAAIRDFNADRDLHRLGYDPADPVNAPLRSFLSTNALAWDIIYERNGIKSNGANDQQGRK